MNKKVEMHFEKDEKMKAQKREEMAAIARKQFEEIKEASQKKAQLEKLEAQKWNQ